MKDPVQEEFNKALKYTWDQGHTQGKHEGWVWGFIAGVLATLAGVSSYFLMR